jgi:Domain of unknown function (DUF4331)/Phage integrase family
MSHHYSGPDISFPHGDARLDLSDLYAFPKPGSAGRSILIMNVHPSSSVRPPGQTSLEPFAADALYEFKIDTDGDAVADIAYRVRFSRFTDGAQQGVNFKQPKSKAGRREITLPDILVDTLRDYRRELLELRLKLGAGKLQDDDLLLTDLDCVSPLRPSAISEAWSDYAAKIGMPKVTFHALRHTHASQLIDQGVNIIMVSRRLGHLKPDTTLRTYAHLYRKDDSKAAEAINASFK